MAQVGDKVLITGGAGFIGSHLADALLESGHEVRVLDALSSQAHGDPSRPPSYLNSEIELQIADIRDADAVARALEGVNKVFHFAAAVGVGQSMYEVRHYTDVNTVGTAVLLEQLAKHPVERLVVASSMSIYGEGAYRDADNGIVMNAERSLEDLRSRRWEPIDIKGRQLRPIATPEIKLPLLSSVYAQTKFDQERLCLMLGKAFRIPSVALRFFNVYGPRQALSNPYTGVLAIFASRLLHGDPPLIFEDGYQRRDFVSVHDVVRACQLAADASSVDGVALNIGSGEDFSVLEVAESLADVLGRGEVDPEITGHYRVGDIRHCFADISLAREMLGYEPRVSLESGLQELAEWLGEQDADDRVASATSESSPIIS